MISHSRYKYADNNDLTTIDRRNLHIRMKLRGFLENFWEPLFKNLE
jgi:hypothetical protein